MSRSTMPTGGRALAIASNVTETVTIVALGGEGVELLRAEKTAVQRQTVLDDGIGHVSIGKVEHQGRVRLHWLEGWGWLA